MDDTPWRTVGANHYNKLIRRVFVGFYLRFAGNSQWRVYKMVEDVLIPVKDCNSEEEARREAGELVKKLTELYKG